MKQISYVMVKPGFANSKEVVEEIKNISPGIWVTRRTFRALFYGRRGKLSGKNRISLTQP